MLKSRIDNLEKLKMVKEVAGQKLSIEKENLSFKISKHGGL